MLIQALLLVARWIGLAQDRALAALCRRRPLAAELAATLGRVDRLQAENDLLRARLRRLDPSRRPRFRPWERLAILAHRLRHGLSIEATADAFVVARGTVAAWLRDAEQGVSRLVHARRPLNRLPDLVRELSWFLKGEWPRWGSRRISGVLARLGLQASRTSVQRVLRRPPPKPRAAARICKPGSHPKPKAARDMFTVDFTRLGGLFRSVVIGCVIDLFSRKVLAVRVCDREPTAAFAGSLFRDAIRRHGKPKRVLTDRGAQFTSDRFEAALRHHGIRHRFGAVGRPGLPTIDRFFRTMKDEFARGLFLYRSARAIEADLRRFASWYNASRPHWSLKNRSPDEVLAGKPARLIVRAQAGALEVKLLAGDRRLPVFGFRRTA